MGIEEFQGQAMSKESDDATQFGETFPTKSGGNVAKIVALLAVAAAAFFAYRNYGDALSLKFLVSIGRTIPYWSTASRWPFTFWRPASHSLVLRF